MDATSINFVLGFAMGFVIAWIAMMVFLSASKESYKEENPTHKLYDFKIIKNTKNITVEYTYNDKSYSETIPDGHLLYQYRDNEESIYIKYNTTKNNYKITKINLSKNNYENLIKFFNDNKIINNN